MEYEAKEDLENGKLTVTPKGFSIPFGWSDWSNRPRKSLGGVVKSYLYRNGTPYVRTYSKAPPSGRCIRENIIYNNLGVFVQTVTDVYTIEVYIPSSHPNFEKLLNVVVSAGKGIDEVEFERCLDMWQGHCFSFIRKLAIARRGNAERKEDEWKNPIATRRSNPSEVVPRPFAHVLAGISMGFR